MITLVGVGHVFELRRQVRGIILKRRPEVVCIELDRGRFEAMLSKTRTGDAPFMYKLLALLQRYIASRYEVQLGEEMLTAARAAKEIGAKLAFIDMDAAVFYQRVMATMSFPEKVKMLFGSFTGLFIRKKRIDQELEKFETNEEEYMEMFEKQMPSVKKVLVDDRNDHMARAIREINKDHHEVVAVVGDGHVEGIRKLIGDLGPDVVRLRELREFKEVPESAGREGGSASVSYSFELRQ
ncbi:MAG: TraB/GumN family protein [Thermoplasmata archaeon]|nr:TraB/GumN family protein [Thermoplasmata archaeon]